MSSGGCAACSSPKAKMTCERGERCTWATRDGEEGGVKLATFCAACVDYAVLPPSKASRRREALMAGKEEAREDDEELAEDALESGDLPEEPSVIACCYRCFVSLSSAHPNADSPDSLRRFGVEFLGARAEAARLLLFVVHGGGGSRKMWYRQVCVWLQQDPNLRLALVDLSGHGSCDRRPLQPTTEVQRLAALLDRRAAPPEEHGAAKEEEEEEEEEEGAHDDDDWAAWSQRSTAAQAGDTAAFEAWVEAQRGLAVRGLPETTPVVYVGNSLGGYIGMQLLGASPDVADAAVICGAGQNVGVGAGLAARFGTWMLTKAASALSQKTLLTKLVQQASGNKHIIQEALTEGSLRPGAFFEQGAAQTAIMKASDAAKELDAYGAAVLFVNGAKDHHDSQDRWLAAAKGAKARDDPLSTNPKESQLRCYPDADHFFSADERFADVYANDILDFAERVCGLEPRGEDKKAGKRKTKKKSGKGKAEEMEEEEEDGGDRKET